MQLLSTDRPEGKNIRLHVTLLRVPMQEAAAAMLADTAAIPEFWRTRLVEWRKAGRLESIVDCGCDGEDREEQSPLATGKHRFIRQEAAARFWMWQQQSKEDPKAEPPNPNDLLQELGEDDVGTRFKATVSMNHGWQQALVNVQLLQSPRPENRPATTWPLPLLTAPRVLFRPWSLNTTALCPVNEPFLLGTQ
ncbi:MAG: hypothetical protein U0984_15970, partial [Prosthecobacter sp.]|nr:hypothetical protein [Prosthecobacter sp.]